MKLQKSFFSAVFAKNIMLTVWDFRKVMFY